MEKKAKTHVSSFCSGMFKTRADISFDISSIRSISTDSLFKDEDDMRLFLERNHRPLELFLIDLLGFEDAEPKLFSYAQSRYRVSIRIASPRSYDLDLKFEIEDDPTRLIAESNSSIAESFESQLSTDSSLCKLSVDSYHMSGLDETSILNRRIESPSESEAFSDSSIENAPNLSDSDPDEYLTFCSEKINERDEELSSDKEMEIYYVDVLEVPVDIYMQLRFHCQNRDKTVNTDEFKAMLHEWLDFDKPKPLFQLSSYGLNWLSEGTITNDHLQVSLFSWPPKKLVHAICAFERVIRYLDPVKLRTLDISICSSVLGECSGMCLYLIGDRCRKLSHLIMRGYKLTRDEDENALEELFYSCKWLQVIDMTDCVINQECYKLLDTKMKNMDNRRSVEIIKTNWIVLNDELSQSN
jgi:hypothetical protein